MLLYLFFNSLLSDCQKKMETEKWPKAADSLLNSKLLDSYNSINSRHYYYAKLMFFILIMIDF